MSELHIGQQKNHKVGHFHFMICFCRSHSFYGSGEKNHKVAMRSKETILRSFLQSIPLYDFLPATIKTVTSAKVNHKVEVPEFMMLLPVIAKPVTLPEK